LTDEGSCFGDRGADVFGGYSIGAKLPELWGKPATGR
jgi:hypothetical protein